MGNINKALIDIIAEKLCGKEVEIDNLTDKELRSLCRLSSKQGVSHIISSYFFEKNILLEGKTAEYFKKLSLKTVYTAEQMKYDLSIIGKAFNEQAVPYIPLKGAVLREFYPDEYMRTSSDIDVLIHEEDIDRAVSSLAEKGFAFKERTYHDILILTPSGNYLELHFNLFEPEENLNIILKNAWDYAIPTEGSRYKFTDKFFLYHFFAHMSYHFLFGGCGIRFLMDLWVIENKMGISLETAKELLEKAGIYEFALKSELLMQVIFMGSEKDEMSDKLLEFMLSGGTVGKQENSIAMSKTKAKKSNTFLFAVGRLFPKYSIMKDVYPVLRKVPFLLPLFWVVRFVAKLKDGKGKSALNEVKLSNSVSDKKISEMQKIRDYMKL